MRHRPRLGAVAHVFLAIAVALPMAVAGLVIGTTLVSQQSSLNRGLLILLSAVFVAAVVWVGLAAPVRQVEVSTARALLGVDLPDVRRPYSWDSRRRGALWLGVLLGIGAIVAVGVLYLLPVGVGLIAQPFSGQTELRWPGGGAPMHTGSGWQAAWLVLPGVLALVACVGLFFGAGGLIARGAPVVIGPTLAERVAGAAARQEQLARANELAREVHDTLGHTMTAMTVQATAARRLLAADPAAAERAMAAVEELGRRAQSDIDQVVGALRDAATASTQAPDDCDGTTDLVAALRPLLDAIPLALALEVPERLALDAECAHTAYRVVQEALTNATRHGTGSAALRLLQQGCEVVLEVRNPTNLTVAHQDRRGLAGMRERVLLPGGTMTAGPDGDRAWLLSVRLPIGRRS